MGDVQTQAAIKPSHIATPPPRGVVRACKERRFGRSTGSRPGLRNHTRAAQATTKAISAGTRELITAHRYPAATHAATAPASSCLWPFFARLAQNGAAAATYWELYASPCSCSPLKKPIPCCNKATGNAAGFWVAGFSLPMDSPVWHNQGNFSVTPEKVPMAGAKLFLANFIVRGEIP